MLSEVSTSDRVEIVSQYSISGMVSLIIGLCQSIFSTPFTALNGYSLSKMPRGLI